MRAFVVHKLVVISDNGNKALVDGRTVLDCRHDGALRAGATHAFVGYIDTGHPYAQAVSIDSVERAALAAAKARLPRAS